MMGGTFYSGLIELGKNLSDNGVELVNILLRSNVRAGVIAGMLLGGLELRNPDDSQLIIQKLRSKGPHERVSGLVAVNVASTESKGDLPSVLRREVIALATSEGESDVLASLSSCLVAICRKTDTEITQLLEALSRWGDDALKFSVVTALFQNGKIEAEAKLRLLTCCARTASPAVHEMICYCLSGLKKEADATTFM
jgi:hypothetical protein